MTTPDDQSGQQPPSFPPPPPPAGGGYQPPPPPPTYPPPGYGGYPQPSPYGATPMAPPQMATAAGTNGFSIAALVCGILPIFAGLLGVIFGFVSLAQIRRSGQRGRGMAIAGIVTGGCWIILVIVLIVIGVTTGVQRNSAGVVTRGGDAQLNTLRVGDCVTSFPTGGQSATLPVVPCSQPHGYQVYYAQSLGLSSYPGETAAKAEVDQLCTEQAATSSLVSPNDDIYYLWPTQQSYDDGRDLAICLHTTS